MPTLTPRSQAIIMFTFLWLESIVDHTAAARGIIAVSYLHYLRVVYWVRTIKNKYIVLQVSQLKTNIAQQLETRYVCSWPVPNCRWRWIKCPRISETWPASGHLLFSALTALLVKNILLSKTKCLTRETFRTQHQLILLMSDGRYRSHVSRWTRQPGKLLWHLETNIGHLDLAFRFIGF